MLVGDLQHYAGRGTEAVEAYERASANAGDNADRCRPLIGRVASNRLIARLDKAFSDLAEAEPLAENGRDDRSLSEIHYLRSGLSLK
jgi:hypothetical protein